MNLFSAIILLSVLTVAGALIILAIAGELLFTLYRAKHNKR